MIADTLENLPLYRGLHPNLDLVIDALDSLDLNSLPDGRHAIHGDDAFLNLSQTRLSQSGTWEAHRNYIDLQLVLQHEETIAWAPLDSISGFSGYDEKKDLMQSDDPQEGSRLLLRAGMFALFFPEDAHQPGLGEGQGRKAVFKIRATVQAVEIKSPLNHLGTVRLDSRRLLLRPFAEGDAQAMFDNWCSDPQVAERVTWSPHPDPAFTQGLLAGWLKEYSRPSVYHWGIEADGKLVGDIAVVTHNEQQLSCEIGYCLSRSCWNQGLMTEALNSVLRFLFIQVGFRRIMLRHLASNPASGKVMQKAGLRPEGVQRQLMKNKQGDFEDVVVYAALRDEWLAENAEA